MLTAAPSLDTRVGTTLAGKYRLEHLLAVGGMASVYQATHRNGNRVAVKILHPEVAVNSEIRSRFLREGRVANRIDHPGATRILDDDTAEDGSVFLVMELLVGETLESRVERAESPLPAEDVAALAWQLLDTLIAAHAKGVIHRDIKPDNLFLTREGVLKVLDFGIAQLLRSGTPGSPALTRAGIILGTPAFLPPEQALGRTEQIDARTDIWAVGATMFWLLSERYVHEAATIEELLVYSGSQAARPVQSVAPETPAALAKVIDRALSFDKSDRFASAREMQDALADAYPGSIARRLTESLATSGTRPRPGARRDPRTAIAVALMFFGSCAIALAFIPRPQHKAATVSTTALVLASPSSQGESVNGAAQSGLERPELEARAYAVAPSKGIEPDALPPDEGDALGKGAPAAANSRANPTPRAASPRRFSAPSAPACVPPYFIDSIGRRIPKPECL